MLFSALIASLRFDFGCIRNLRRKPQRRDGRREEALGSGRQARVILLLVLICPCLARAAGIFSINDPVEFNKIIDTNSVLVTNAFDDTWIEGPVWMPQSG